MPKWVNRFSRKKSPLDSSVADEKEAVGELVAEEEVETSSTPSESELNKMKKAELVELAESLGVSTSGTKKDLVEAILGA